MHGRDPEQTFGRTLNNFNFPEDSYQKALGYSSRNSCWSSGKSLWGNHEGNSCGIPEILYKKYSGTSQNEFRRLFQQALKQTNSRTITVRTPEVKEKERPQEFLYKLWQEFQKKTSGNTWKTSKRNLWMISAIKTSETITRKAWKNFCKKS